MNCEAKGKRKKPSHLAQKALLRLHSRCFYNINYKSNFTAWWQKRHGCMEQLLKRIKSRFSRGGQLRSITRAVQNCGWRRGQSILHLAAGFLVNAGCWSSKWALDSSWCSKVRNAQGLSKNKIICLNLSVQFSKCLTKFVCFQAENC